jgi:hypothetical protein
MAMFTSSYKVGQKYYYKLLELVVKFSERSDRREIVFGEGSM